MPKRYILWALPKGQTDRLHEQPMTSLPLTQEQVERVKSAASKDGWHGFRTVMDTDERPDFANPKLLNR